MHITLQVLKKAPTFTRTKLLKKNENYIENVKKKRKHRFYYKSFIIVILQYHICSLCNFLFSFPFPHAECLLPDAECLLAHAECVMRI